MRKHLLSIVAALGLALMATNTWADTPHQVTGKGSSIDYQGRGVSLQFKANIDMFGNVYGEILQTTKVSGGGLKYHGVVLSFQLLDPHTAVFAGMIDSSNDPAHPAGTFFEVKVVDGSPDQYGFGFTNFPDCNDVNVTMRNLLRGSISVR